MSQDFYELLQVHPKANQEAIEAAYARLRDLYDPARLDGAADELVTLARQKRDDIERAYAVLSDPARRATYDASLEIAKPEAEREPAERAPADPVLDYRPLPPARGSERPKGFDAQPVRAPARRTAGRRARAARPAWLAPAIAVALIAGLLGASYAITGNRGLVKAPPAQPTNGVTDQFEGLIAQTKQIAEQNPDNAQAWIDYGNTLYDSVQVVREQSPDSPLYQLRISRWLSATEAYTKALAIEPNNSTVRSDLGASSCFYGAGIGDTTYIINGLKEARLAVGQAPSDPRVLLNLGHCLISEQPPRTKEAIDVWQKIVQVAPGSPFATQAQAYITRYSAQ